MNNEQPVTIKDVLDGLNYTYHSDYIRESYRYDALKEFVVRACTQYAKGLITGSNALEDWGKEILARISSDDSTTN